LAAPRLVDVHRTDTAIHCFVLDGEGGAALFTEVGQQAITDTRTEQWLRSLDGWASTE